MKIFSKIEKKIFRDLLKIIIKENCCVKILNPLYFSF